MMSRILIAFALAAATACAPGETVPPGAVQERPALRTRPVMICDGGPITFGVEYDPATRRFANFSFNGSI